MSGKKLNPADISTLAYNAIVASLILLFHQRIRVWYLEALLNFGVICFILCIVPAINRHSSKVLRILRDFYPLLFFTLFYEQIGRVSHILFAESLDSHLQRTEYAIFGFQPSSRLAHLLPQIWFAEYMHFAYSCFYLIMPALALLLYRRQDDFKDYLFALCNTSFVCYLIFILLPTVGPRAHAANGFSKGVLFIPLMNAISKVDIEGAAMPSSHVAGAAVVLYYAWRYVPKTTLVFAPICISLMIATVYCGYHYAIDVFGGLLTAAVVIGLSTWAGHRRTDARAKVYGAISETT
jgi:membrane-associated phospholipid phosphatase